MATAFENRVKRDRIARALKFDIDSNIGMLAEAGASPITSQSI
jgi:hypothetical protein